MSHENEEIQSPEGIENPTVSSACMEIVDRYRLGTIQRGQAILELAQKIPVEETGTTESIGTTIKSYIAMLDDWDHKRTLSDTDGRCETVGKQRDNDEEPASSHRQI
jgi:hypothetical protein